MKEEPTPSLWDELIGEGDHRRPAEPTLNLPPGHYDECDYPHQDESEFGLAEFEEELSEIKAEQYRRYMLRQLQHTKKTK